MEHDPFCRYFESLSYTVRSIYLDTRELLFYYEKIQGAKIRKKLRIRTYNSGGPDTPSFLEIKRKHNDTVLKERIGLPLIAARNVMKDLDVILRPQPTFIERAALSKFTFVKQKLHLEPQVLVTYEREALHAVDEQSIADAFEQLLASHTRLSVKSVRMGQFLEHSYLVRLKRGVTDREVISRLSAIEGMERVALLIEETEGEG